jgi:hypothetical protein
MQRYELEAWLGAALDDMTTEQVDTMHAAVEEIHERWSDVDDDAERQAASVAALQHIIGEVSLAERGENLRRARDAEREAVIASRQAALMAVRDGMSESQAARDAGLDRMTVRRMLGK